MKDINMAGRKGQRNHESQQDDRNIELERAEQLLTDEQLQEIYAWVDEIPLSRSKKNITRDFSDGVLVAELLKSFFPNLVEMHNYCACNHKAKKAENWAVLNRKVFRKLNFELSDEVIQHLVNSKPGMVEKVLMMLRSKVDQAVYAKKKELPESEQYETFSPGRKGHIKPASDGAKNSKFGKAKQIEDSKSLSPKPGRKYRLEKELKEMNVKSNAKYPSKGEGNTGELARTQPPATKGQKGQVIPKQRVGNLVESDMVPRYVAEEKEQEVLSRDETIQILQAKVARLEHLLHLKDMRIEDLQNRVEAARPTGVRNEAMMRQQPMQQQRK